MKEPLKIRQLFRIESGILNGTEIELIMGFFAVKYPHRKSKDLYIPPMKSSETEKEVKTWHCNQEPCPTPDFEGGLDALVEHLLLHKGRLIKVWSKKVQLQSPIPAVRIPPNPWENIKGNFPVRDRQGERRFVIQLYMEAVEASLRKQGVEVLE